MPNSEAADLRLLTLLGAASATGAGSSFDLGDMRDEFSLLVTTTGSPTFSVTFQGSVDASDWFTLGSAVTSVTNGTTVTGTLARYVRANLTALSGGTLTAELAFSLALGVTGGGGSATTVTAADTSIVVGGTSAAPTIATATLDVIAADHPPAANWSNNSHKITSLANGSGAQDAAAFGQITAANASALALAGGTMSGAIAMGSHKVTGLTNGTAVGDAINFGQLPSTFGLTYAPSGATGITFDRSTLGGASYPANTHTTLYVRAIAMPYGVAVSNISFTQGNTAQSVGTHGWYCLLDSGLVVRAVSGDQTSTTWNVTQNNAVTLSVSASAYTTTYAGLYYVGFCTTSTTEPTITCGPAGVSGTISIAPILMGSIATGYTSAPPSTGSTMGAITGNASYNFLAWTS